MVMTKYNFNAIATVRSCYKEKFGIPRQPGLVASPAVIEISRDYSQDEAFRELEKFTHIWIIFVFHGVNNEKWKPTVRPPRLGGNQRIGVFATRSMFRPNPIGLSVVELKSVERKEGKVLLNILGGDFLDATPVLDIKPYIPYVDAINDAKAGYAENQPEIKFEVLFSSVVKEKLASAEIKYPMITRIITELLQLDPRPAYKDKKQEKNEFAIKLYDYDVKWHIDDKQIVVTELKLLN